MLPQWRTFAAAHAADNYGDTPQELLPKGASMAVTAVGAIYCRDRDESLLQAYVVWGGPTEAGDVVRYEDRVEWSAQGRATAGTVWGPETKVRSDWTHGPKMITATFIPPRPEQWRKDPEWYKRPGRVPHVRDAKGNLVPTVEEMGGNLVQAIGEVQESRPH